MKLLVSTKKTQGFRDSDFCFVPEDQIVMFGSECDYLEDFENDDNIDKDEYIDGCCGCHRSMMGILNNKSTTTMKVVDLDISREELYDLIYECYRRANLLDFESENRDLTTSINNDIDSMIEVAEIFEVGDIIERRGDEFKVRKLDFDPFHIEKSIISEIEERIRIGLQKKKNIISRSNKLITYRGAQISESEARSLQELEILLKENFKLVKEVEENEIPSFSISSHHITSIDLYGLGLKSLPSSFGNLFKLRKLNLKFNNIRVLQDTIGNLTSLRNLNLEDNRLKYLPETIGNLKSLQILELSVNHLIEIPESIGNLLNLNTLKLSFNKLNLLPETIDNLQMLQVLDLGNNQITSLPDALGELKNLKKLYLNTNNLMSFPDSIMKLKSLEELYLNKNQISFIPETISNLTALSELYLPNNNISNIPESLIYLESLQELNLKYNPLKIKGDSKIEKMLKMLEEKGVDIIL